MWPFTERIDPLYNTVQTIVYSGNYVFKPASQSDPLNIEYGITADVVDRDDFKLHELLDEENKDKFFRTLIDGVIYACLACYHVDYERDEYYRFHEILEITKEKTNLKINVREKPEHINNLISKIEKALCEKTTCGIKFTCFNFKGAKKYVPPEKQSLAEVKQMRGKYVDFEVLRERGIEVHGTYKIKVAIVPTEDYIHIQWRYNEGFFDPTGYIKIYRRKYSFFEDKKSETNNGDLIADSAKNTFAFADEDNLDENTYYCYTVNLKHKYSDSKGEYKIDHIARVRVKLRKPEAVKEEEKPEKPPIEMLKERQANEREEQIVTHDHKRGQMFNDLRACIKNKENASAFIEAYKEERLNKIKASKGRLSKEDRESVEKMVEELEDRANTILSEIDEK